jgi:hypothetical protein
MVRGVVDPGGVLDRGDLVEDDVHGRGKLLVDRCRVVAFDQVGLVSVAGQQRRKLIVADPDQDRRIGDLISVEVQDRQDRTVTNRVEELVRVPGRRERPGLGLTITDHAGDHQVRVVQRGTVGVGQRVPEFAALVDRPGGLRGDVAGNSAGERELGEQPAHARLVARDPRIRLGVGDLQPGVGDQTRAAVAGPGDVDQVLAPGGDDPRQVGVEQVEARGGAPVPEQPGLDLFRRQGFAQQRVAHQIDLTDRQVVGRSPVCVDPGRFFGVQRMRVNDVHGLVLPRIRRRPR